MESKVENVAKLQVTVACYVYSIPIQCSVISKYLHDIASYSSNTHIISQLEEFKHLIIFFFLDLINFFFTLSITPNAYKE
jgi:hypothetical protein